MIVRSLAVVDTALDQNVPSADVIGVLRSSAAPSEEKLVEPKIKYDLNLSVETET